MVKIIWTERSLTDMEDIAQFIAKDFPKYAKLTVEKILTVHHSRREVGKRNGFYKK